MKTERLFERVADYRNSLARLREALLAPESDLIRDAAIQRFEFTYEMAWKTLKLLLEAKGMDVRNPRDALREALQQGMIDDGNGWTLLHEKRNLTTHTYDEALAREVYEFLKNSGVALFDALEREIQRRIGEIGP